MLTIEYTMGVAQEADRRELMSLWHYCFMEDRGGGFIPWYFQNRFQTETTYLAKTKQLGKQKIAAAIYAPETPFLCRGKRFDTPYIQGVAIPPEYRGQGAAKATLQFTLERLCAKKQPLAVLKPFDPAFYQRSGWQFFAYLLKYHIPMSKLPAVKPSRDLRFQFIEEPQNVLADMARLYEAWLTQMVPVANRALRDEGLFAKLLADHYQDNGNLLLAYDQDNVAVGYMLYTMTGNEFFIREAAFTQKRVMDSFLALAREHSSQVKNVLLIAPYGAQSRVLLPELLQGVAIYPFAMARLLDFGSAIRDISVPEAVNYSCTEAFLCLEDELLEHQAGTWRIWVEQGKIKAEKVEARWKNQEKTIKIEIKVLTKIYLGCYNFKDYLHCRQSVTPQQWEAAAMLDALLPMCDSYFYEYF